MVRTGRGRQLLLPQPEHPQRRVRRAGRQPAGGRPRPRRRHALPGGDRHRRARRPDRARDRDQRSRLLRLQRVVPRRLHPTLRRRGGRHIDHRWLARRATPRTYLRLQRLRGAQRSRLPDTQHGQRVLRSRYADRVRLGRAGPVRARGQRGFHLPRRHRRGIGPERRVRRAAPQGSLGDGRRRYRVLGPGRLRGPGILGRLERVPRVQRRRRRPLRPRELLDLSRPRSRRHRPLAGIRGIALRTVQRLRFHPERQVRDPAASHRRASAARCGEYRIPRTVHRPEQPAPSRDGLRRRPVD